MADELDSKKRVAWNKGLKGGEYKKHFENGFKGTFQKGIKPWITGRKGANGIGNGLKGKKMPDWWKDKLRGKKEGRFGHVVSEETRGKIRQKMRLRTGEKNPRWKGGMPQLKYNRLRQKRVREAIGSHTIGEWELLKKQYNFTCPCCRKSEPEIKLTEDHIIPISKGGSNWIENIQPLCLRCNTKKFTKIVKYING